MLDVPLTARRNLVYCSTFQIVWDDLVVAKQYIRFQLDESDAVLESEARAMFAAIGDEPEPDRPPDRPRQFVFDRPFLLALRQPKAEEPYFVTWIGNLELLCPESESRP